MQCSHQAMATVPKRVVRRRAHKRYIVSGTAEVGLNGSRVLGRVVTIGARGMLVRCPLGPPLGSEVEIEFSVTGFDEGRPLIARGRVAWTQPGQVGVEFLEDPPGLIVLQLWLENERYCWSDID